MEQRKYLTNLQKSDPENRKCVDCTAMATFIDLKYGSFLCTNCAGLHRELGTDYCVVKSISLDNLTNEQLKKFKETKGNTFVNLEYEALDHKEVARLKPRPDTAVQFVREFIRKKYKVRQFYKQYVAPIQEPPPKKVEPVVNKPIVEDLLKFEEPVKIQQPINNVLNQIQTPHQNHQFEVNWNENIQTLPQQTTFMPQPLLLTVEQQKELEHKKKVNDIMNMFNYYS